MKSSKHNLLTKIKELLSTRDHLLTTEIAKELDISIHAVFHLIRNGDLVVTRIDATRKSVKVVDVCICSDSNTEKAHKRASILWDYYKKHGKLLTQDVYDLCGQSYGNVYRTFNINDIGGPPVWNSKSEIARRKANALITLADELERDFLTEDQVVQCLSIRKDRLHSVLDGIRKYYDIPMIGEEPFSYDSISRVDESYYPSGLQVLDARPGPDGTTIYRIR